MFHVELAPLGGILGPLKSNLGVFWAKIPIYPYNVKTQKTHFLKTLEWADFDLLESNSRDIFLHKNQKIYHGQFFFSWYMFSSHVISQALSGRLVIWPSAGDRFCKLTHISLFSGCYNIAYGGDQPLPRLFFTFLSHSFAKCIKKNYPLVAPRARWHLNLNI